MWCVANVAQGLLMLADPYLWPPAVTNETPPAGDAVAPGLPPGAARRSKAGHQGGGRFGAYAVGEIRG
eukprot:1194553-Prorocentrum_minimum.AAC.1